MSGRQIGVLAKRYKGDVNVARTLLPTARNLLGALKDVLGPGIAGAKTWTHIPGVDIRTETSAAGDIVTIDTDPERLRHPHGFYYEATGIHDFLYTKGEKFIPGYKVKEIADPGSGTIQWRGRSHKRMLFFKGPESRYFLGATETEYANQLGDYVLNHAGKEIPMPTIGIDDRIFGAGIYGEVDGSGTVVAFGDIYKLTFSRRTGGVWTEIGEFELPANGNRFITLCLFNRRGNKAVVCTRFGGLFRIDLTFDSINVVTLQPPIRYGYRVTEYHDNVQTVETTSTATTDVGDDSVVDTYDYGYPLMELEYTDFSTFPLTGGVGGSMPLDQVIAADWSLEDDSMITASIRYSGSQGLFGITPSGDFINDFTTNFTDSSQGALGYPTAPRTAVDAWLNSIDVIFFSINPHPLYYGLEVDTEISHIERTQWSSLSTYEHTITSDHTSNWSNLDCSIVFSTGGSIPFNKLLLNREFHLNSEFHRDGSFSVVKVVTGPSSATYTATISKQENLDYNYTFDSSLDHRRCTIRFLDIRSKSAVLGVEVRTEVVTAEAAQAYSYDSGEVEDVYFGSNDDIAGNTLDLGLIVVPNATITGTATQKIWRRDEVYKGTTLSYSTEWQRRELVRRLTTPGGTFNLSNMFTWNVPVPELDPHSTSDTDTSNLTEFVSAAGGSLDGLVVHTTGTSMHSSSAGLTLRYHNYFYSGTPFATLASPPVHILYLDAEFRSIADYVGPESNRYSDIQVL